MKIKLEKYTRPNGDSFYQITNNGEYVIGTTKWAGDSFTPIDYLNTLYLRAIDMFNNYIEGFKPIPERELTEVILEKEF